MDRYCKDRHKNKKKKQGTNGEGADAGADGGADGKNKKKEKGMLKKPVLSSNDYRLWADWLIRVMEQAEYDWDEWLISHLSFLRRLSENLLKAEGPPDIRCTETENIHISDPCLGDRMRRSDKKQICKDMPDSVSFNILCRSEMNVENKYIEIPKNKEEMDKILDNFQKNVEKYKNLYDDWTKLAEMVVDEIEGRIEPSEPVGPEQKIIHFQYLKDKKPRDLGIQINEEEVTGSENGRELINCGDKKLFFNLSS